jgi:uncharacterized membrane protein
MVAGVTAAFSWYIHQYIRMTGSRAYWAYHDHAINILRNHIPTISFLWDLALITSIVTVVTLALTRFDKRHLAAEILLVGILCLLGLTNRWFCPWFLRLI